MFHVLSDLILDLVHKSQFVVALDALLAYNFSWDDGSAISIQSLGAFQLFVQCYLRLLIYRAHLLVSSLNIEAVLIILNIGILLVRDAVILGADVAIFSTAASSCSLDLYFLNDIALVRNCLLRGRRSF